LVRHLKFAPEKGPPPSKSGIDQSGHQAVAAAKDVVHIIADLSGVDFLDSTGLGVLVGGLKRVREHGGSLTPVISSTRILHILRITGLTRVLPPQPSVQAAIDADPHWRQTVDSEAGSAGEWCRQHGLP
jgi:anti-sigma B factor antagonist